MNALLANDFRLVHFFHRVNFLSFFEFHTPNFAESSLSYDVLAIEVISVYFLTLQNKPAFLFFFGVELGEVDFEAVLYVLGGFFRMVELLLLCSFSRLVVASLLSLPSSAL